MATVTETTSIPSNQISVYGHPSPVNSTTTTPPNNSPTAPRLQHPQVHSRQLRPLKGPLYVPAALRPTERPQKSSPPTPPRSMHGSLDSLSDEESSAPVSRRSTMESNFNSSISKLAEDEWMKTEHLGEVTGLPTREHWKADAVSPSCDSPTCRSSFGLFLRRHHCRHCGHVFCSSHTPHLVPLDQDARFHPEGVPSRACDLCWSAYQRWEEARNERLNKIQSILNAQQESTTTVNTDTDNTTTPAEATETSQKGGAVNTVLNRAQGQITEIAASIPRGWNWSTF